MCDRADSVYFRKVCIDHILSISNNFSEKIFNIPVSGKVVSCFHPITNEGLPDEDYKVVSVSGFEKCDIWIYKGEINVRTTLQRLELLGVTEDDLSEVLEIYRLTAALL